MVLYSSFKSTLVRQDFEQFFRLSPKDVNVSSRAGSWVEFEAQVKWSSFFPEPSFYSTKKIRLSQARFWHYYYFFNIKKVVSASLKLRQQIDAMFGRQQHAAFKIFFYFFLSIGSWIGAEDPHGPAQALPLGSSLESSGFEFFSCQVMSGPNRRVRLSSLLSPNLPTCMNLKLSFPCIASSWISP